MSRFEYLQSVAWLGPGQSLTDHIVRKSFDGDKDSELACRLCNLADSAASAYTGLFPVEWSYFSFGGCVDLPWLLDWYTESRKEGSDEISIRLSGGTKDRFFTELKQFWIELQRQKEDSATLDPLDALFSTKLTSTKRGSIQSLSALILCLVNDGLLFLRAAQYDEVALCMSNAYQCLIHLQSDSASYVSGQSRGGKIRHLNDPKAKDKEFVYQCWRTWDIDSNRYSSVAEFARDMFEKTEHLAGDPQVIGRWVRAWRKQKSTS